MRMVGEQIMSWCMWMGGWRGGVMLSLEVIRLGVGVWIWGATALNNAAILG